MPKVTDPRLLAALGGGQSGAIPLTPPNPTVALDQDLKRLQIQKGGADLARVPLENSKLSAEAQAAQAAAGRAPFQNMEAQAAAQKAQIDAQRAQREAILAQGNPNGLSADKRTEAIARYQSLGNLDRGVTELQGMYDKSFKGKRLSEYAPSWMRPENGTFDVASGRLTAFIANALGLSGQQFNTPEEQKLFIGSYLPKASDPDEVIQNKLRALSDMANKARGDGEAMLGGRPDATGKIIPITPPGGPQQGIATGATRTEADPKAAALIDAMIRSGADDGRINAGLTAMGYPGVDPSQTRAAREYLRKNPNYKGSFGAATREVPQGAMNRMSGSAAGQGVRGYMSGLTGGFDDEMAGGVRSLVTGEPWSAATADLNDKKQLAAETFPGANFVGNLAGGVTGMATGAGIASKLGLAAKLGKAAPLLGDMAYGGLSGAGESNDNRLLGAGLGAGLALGGRGMFAGGSRLLGKMTRGIQDLGVRQLANEAPLTGGQILGGGWKSLEDKLTSYIDPIKTRRTEGLQQWNAARFDEAGLSTGQYGEGAIDAARGIKNRAYNAAHNAIDSAGVKTDPQLTADLAAARLVGEGIPGRGADFSYTMKQKVDPNLATGDITGSGYQAMIKGIRTDRRGLMSSERGGDFADALTGVENALHGAVGRQAPGAADLLTNANVKNRHLSILADAVTRGKNTGGVFTPAQLGDASVANAKRFQGNITAATPNRPFFESQRLAQDVLPSKVPDSGTAGRMALLAPLIGGGAVGGGAGYAAGDAQSGTGVGTGLGAGSLLIASLMNSKAGRKAVEQMLLKRSPEMVKLGGKMVDIAPKAGMFGRGLGVSLLPYLN